MLFLFFSPLFTYVYNKKIILQFWIVQSYSSGWFMNQLMVCIRCHLGWTIVWCSSEKARKWVVYPRMWIGFRDST